MTMQSTENANRDAVREFDDPAPFYESEEAYEKDRMEQSRNVIEDVENDPERFKQWLDDPLHADVVGIDDTDPFGEPRPRIPKVLHEARKRSPSTMDDRLFARRRAVEQAQRRLAMARRYQQPPVIR